MIDVYAVVTNGRLVSDPTKFRVIDPLGYFVVSIEEEIVVVPPSAGGGMMPGQSAEEELRKKIIKITVSSADIQYTETIEVKDLRYSVKDVKMKDNKVYVEIYNPELNDSYTETIKIEIRK